ncbi:MAG: hypothetical protein Q8K36_01375, partial [Alphaproteobacteria bacterium]|nr:hypothetical protein [Alphaproteobacteria bacterium]
DINVASLTEELDSLTNSIECLRGRKDYYKGLYAELNARVGAAEAAFRSKQGEMEGLSKDKDGLIRDVHALQLRLAAMEPELKHLNRENQRLQEDLAQSKADLTESKAEKDRVQKLGEQLAGKLAKNESRRSGGDDVEKRSHARSNTSRTSTVFEMVGVFVNGDMLDKNETKFVLDQLEQYRREKVAAEDKIQAAIGDDTDGVDDVC